MVRIYLVRHGETDWNLAGRLQGARDISVNERGRVQAQQVATLLADKPLQAVYSSPLIRAWETARAVAAAHNLEITLVESLKEIDVGQWEGLSREEIAAADPELWQKWRQDPHRSAPPPGGEHYTKFQARCLDALEVIARDYEDDEEVAVITHGGVIKAVMAGLLGIPWQSRGIMYFLNCSVTRLRWRYGGRVVIDGFNEAHHLSEVNRDRK